MAKLVRLHILGLDPERRATLLIFVERKGYAHNSIERFAIVIGQVSAEPDHRWHHGSICRLLGPHRERAANKQNIHADPNPKSKHIPTPRTSEGQTASTYGSEKSWPPLGMRTLRDVASWVPDFSRRCANVYP